MHYRSIVISSTKYLKLVIFTVKLYTKQKSLFLSPKYYEDLQNNINALKISKFIKIHPPNLPNAPQKPLR